MKMKTQSNSSVVTVNGVTYFMEPKLIQVWDSLRGNKLVEKDEDRIYIVDGRERCQPGGSKVLMADGSWKSIEDVKVGDLVISPNIQGNNSFSEVLSTTSYMCDKTYDVYEYARDHQKLYSCSKNHLIPFNVKVYPRKQGTRPKELAYWKIKNYEAQYFAKLTKRSNKETTSLSSPKIERFLGKENFVIEPYSLGAFLGDGCLLNSGISLTTMDEEIIDEVSRFYPPIRKATKKNNKASSYFFSKRTLLYKQLNDCGLFGKRSGDKFIPKEALLSDSNYRLRLLAGLIDTDGTLGKTSGYSICTKSKQMADDILNLVYSLGGRAKVRPITKGIKSTGFIGNYFNVSFYLGDTDIPVKLRRKKRVGKTFYLSPNRVSIVLKESGPTKVYGFTLDSQSNLYITDNWMVTHNCGKSLFAIQQAAYIDPTFAKNIAGRICFTPEDFLKAIRSCPKGSVIIFDEAFRGLSSRSAVSKVNKLIIQALMEAGQRNLILFIVLPSFFMLDIYAAMHRSTCLFHVYKSKQGRRGYFRVYNYKKKAQLYQIGLKKGMSYRKPFSKFAGRFYGKYPIDEEQYRKMKYDALIQSEMNPKAGYNNKWEVRSKKMIALLKKELNLSFKDLGELFKRHDIDLERSQLTNIYNEMATVPQKPTNSNTTIYSK